MLMNRSSTLFLTSCGHPDYCKSNQRRFAPTSCPHHRNQVPTSLEYALRGRLSMLHSPHARSDWEAGSVHCFRFDRDLISNYGSAWN